MDITYFSRFKKQIENENTKITAINLIKEDDAGGLYSVSFIRSSVIYRVKFIDNRIYIGQTANFNNRMEQHNLRFGSINIDNVKIIKYYAEQDDEINYIRKYRKRYGWDNVVNVDRGSVVPAMTTDIISRWFNRTPSQLAIKSWYYYCNKENKCTLAEAAAKTGASVANVKRANKIGGVKQNQFKRPDILDLLYNGEKFPLDNFMETDSLAAIENFLRKQELSRKEKLTGIAVNKEELSEAENDIVDSILIKIDGEANRVKKAIASKIYAQVMQ
jgi:hypothetical protein